MSFSKITRRRLGAWQRQIADDTNRRRMRHETDVERCPVCGEARREGVMRNVCGACGYRWNGAALRAAQRLLTKLDAKEHGL